MPTLQEILDSNNTIRKYLVRYSDKDSSYGVRDEMFVVTAPELRALLAIKEIFRPDYERMGNKSEEIFSIFGDWSLTVMTDDQEWIGKGQDMGVFPRIAQAVQELIKDSRCWCGSKIPRSWPRGHEWGWLRSQLSFDDWTAVRIAWGLPKVKRVGHGWEVLPKK